MAVTLDGRVVVPVADPEDAARTARTLVPSLGSNARVIVVHVIEKAGGAPDKASVEQREEYAEDVFDLARGPLEDAGVSVDSEILYGTDVVETIFDAAADRNAEAIAFVPRGGGTFVRLLTGDVARKLVEEASIPVVALPRTETED